MYAFQCNALETWNTSIIFFNKTAVNKALRTYIKYILNG